MQNPEIQKTVKIGQREKVLLIIGLYCFISTAMLVVFEFSTGLPAILADIGGMEFVSLVFTINMLGAAIISPIAGNLSHIYGRRTVLLFGMAILILAEFLGAFVTNISQLIVLRGLQGIGGGFAITISLIVIADVCTKEERAKFLGFYGSLIGGLIIAGPLLGGIIVDNLSWRWIFLSVVPIGLIGFFLIFRFMPVIPKSKNSKIDLLGSFLMTFTISMIVLITVWGGSRYAWGSPTIIILSILTIIALLLFIATENRVEEPIIPMSLFGNITFTICFLSAFLVSMAGAGLTNYFPLFAQEIRGLTATHAGLLMTTKGVTALIASAANGWIISRVKEFRWNALVIMLFFSLSSFALYLMDAKTSLVMIMAAMILWGLSGGGSNVFHIGTQMSLNNLQIVTAMGALQLAVSIGATIGNVIIGVLLKNPDFTAGIQNIFLMALVSGLVVVMFTIVLLLQRNKSTSITK